MSQIGWIKLHRKITECEIWLEDEPFSKRDAWIDLLLMANHTTKNIVIGNQTIEVKPGQRITSQAKLAERWRWGIGRVRRYLDLLQELGMITWSAERKWTVINVLNYAIYQDTSTNNGTITERNRNDNGTITETNKNDKEYKECKEDNIYAVVGNSKYISKGYNVVVAVENALGFTLTRLQAEQFTDLFEEVGEYAFQKGLEKAAEKNARNYKYVATVAKGIAAGNDFDNKPKTEGKWFDKEKILAMVEEMEKEDAT